MAESELDLPGDRGVREIQGLAQFEYLNFGLIVAALQERHPNTLVRATSSFHRSTGLWDVRVTWWQRGTEQP